jgi:hypothetical protein
MRLHENQQLFNDAILAASRPKDEGGLGIKSIFIEKDYWICRSLSLMAEDDKECRAIFKGGTSLSKAFGIGARFSEDIDIAIAEAQTLNGNQLKNLIKNTVKSMTFGLKETVIPGATSKGSHYYKAFYAYPRQVATNQVGAIKAGQLLIEINSFANPYPSKKCEISSFLTQFLHLTGNQELIEKYEMEPFTVSVLDKRRTMIEKTISLIRCSLASDSVTELTAKIRHFYDLHFLLQDEECLKYLKSNDFYKESSLLFKHDQMTFEKPEGWLNKNISESPLLLDWPSMWSKLQDTYLRELPELAYKEIPTKEEIEESFSLIVGRLTT